MWTLSSGLHLHLGCGARFFELADGDGRGSISAQEFQDSVIQASVQPTRLDVPCRSASELSKGL